MLDNNPIATRELKRKVLRAQTDHPEKVVRRWSGVGADIVRQVHGGDKGAGEECTEIVSKLRGEPSEESAPGEVDCCKVARRARLDGLSGVTTSSSGKDTGLRGTLVVVTSTKDARTNIMKQP